MFTTIIESFIFASVGIALLRSYLTINKIWTRKADENVANSISVFAALLGLIATLPFFIKYAFIDSDYSSAFNMLLGLVVSFVLLLVGSGLWVAGRRRKLSFWTKFKRAIKLETDEVGDLVKAFIQPKGAGLIIDILRQIALIDKRLDKKESEFIQIFAKSWFLDYDSTQESSSKNSQDSNYILLRNSVASYLDILPPQKQAAQLIDVIDSLVNIDSKVSKEENFILEEINGMLDDYVNQNDQLTRFEVVIAPQSTDQEDSIKQLIPGFTLSENKGGLGYIAGIYYSERMARMICQKYRSLNLFTAIEKIEARSQRA